MISNEESGKVQDKTANVNYNNNSSSPSITAPKGGGAISTIGEKFQANPVTGTGSMSVPITISPGRNEFTPQLSLSYDSGSGNSEFGMGWSIGLPSISRKTQKGLPKYQDSIESDIFLLAGSEDLVPKLTENSGNWEEVIAETNGIQIKQYRPRIEGLHAKIEKHVNLNSGETHWQITTKDNITSVYGKTAAARVFDDADTNRVFQWILEYTYDEKGNIIWYQYKQENSVGISKSKLSEKNRLENGSAYNKIYLKSVKYTPDTPFAPTDNNYFTTTKWHFQLILDYGEHDLNNPTITETNPWTVRQDAFSTFRSGFEIRTYRLCRRFLMFHHFEAELGVDPYLVKSTELSYNENTIASRVNSVKHVCHKAGESPAEYPPIDFTYSEARIDPSIYQHSVEDLQNLPVGVDNIDYRWTDLYGEGLAGVLFEDQNAWYFKRNLGNENYYKDYPANQVLTPEARLAKITEVIDKPSLSGEITDLDGNGTPGLVAYREDFAGYYERTTKGEWKPFVPFDSTPNIDWNDPDLRRIDINGNGFADLLVTRDNCFVIYPSKVKEGFEASYEVLQSFEEEDGPKIIFSDSDQSIYLVDMTGDGLSDILRIKNGSVCFWPNVGYGHFGAKVSMDNAPYFDHEDIFNQNRIRLADVDGSGTTDIIYLADNCIKYYPNESGNSLGEAIIINQQLPTHNLAQITTLDLLGSGTQCLVWSSPIEGDLPPALKYIDLMGAIKPYLLTEVNNNMGSLTRLKYAPSTKFYLRDERNGTPWITKLPFPVQVVERMEMWDEVNRNRFVSKYAYHHGYFDGDEREFRGFGMVEQWDTESFTDFVGEGLFPPGYNASEEILHVPPIHTKTWFHTGFYEEKTKILNQYRSEYWNGDNQAYVPQYSELDVFSNDFDHNREAARALKGNTLRTEVYSRDGSTQENNPYVVTENVYDLQSIQPRASKRRDRDYASFQVITIETISYQYERNPNDPRINHQLTLQIDEYGHLLKSAAVVYPRRTSAGFIQQDQSLISIQENTLINLPDSSNFYRLSVPIESKSYELSGLNITQPTSGLRTSVLNAFQSAIEIAYEATPSAGVEKRLLDHSRVHYYDETLTSTPLAFGLVASHGLPFESYQLAMTNGQISNILNEDGVVRVDHSIMVEGGYVNLLSDGNYWIPSGQLSYDPSNFYTVSQRTDAFGNQTQYNYDSHFLMPSSTTDALGNETSGTYDYRVLQPDLVTDPNGNRQAFAFDVRGMITKIAVMGKVGSSVGDTLSNPTAEYFYDLFAWTNSQQPNWVHSLTREEHGSSNTRFQETYTYSNGLGQVVMAKNKVAPGEAFLREPDGSLTRDGNNKPTLGQVTERWVGNGRAILNNKGNPVKQYESYFSSTSKFESDAELVEYGVTPVVHYDPLSRAIRTELPDNTSTLVTFTPWEQNNYDQNDTVKSSLWFTSRNSPDPNLIPEPTDKDERAAWLAAKHADTPKTIRLDVLGRPFQTQDDNGADGIYTMTTKLDILGNPLNITDSKGRVSTSYFYNVLSDGIKTTHIDYGVRYTISDVANNSLRDWDARKNEFRFSYDELRRPTKAFLTPDFDTTPGTEQLISLTVYGESISNPEANNLKGQVYLSFDSSGMTKNVNFDFKGNSINIERQLASAYLTSPDWITLDTNTSIANLLASASGLLDPQVFQNTGSYDAQNRPTSLIRPDNSEILPLYDEGGKLKSVGCKIKGAITPTEFVSVLTYNSRGQRKYITYGNGAHTTYHYDEKTFRLIRLITTRNNGADLLQDLNYTYDAIGNVVEIIDDAQQTIFFNNSQVTPNTKYEYDALNRLLSSTGRQMTGIGAPSNNDVAIQNLPDNNASALESYVQSYQYDELGNILQMAHAANSGSWTKYYHYSVGFTNNFLLSTSPNNVQPGVDEYTYDAHGNMVSMPHLSSIDWDFADRLQNANLGGGGNVYNTYDGTGQRLRKVIINGNIKEERIYLGEYELYRKSVNGSLDTERETLHISDDAARIAVAETLTVDSGNTVNIPTTNLRYMMSNHLGTATLELDNSALVISYEEYHPFGSTSYRSGRNLSEASLKRYRYVGKERDEETGLYYYGARYYATWLARFISVDPLKDDYPQLSPFNYAGNKPINEIDIDGLQGSNEEKRPDGVNLGTFESNTTASDGKKLVNLSSNGVKIGETISQTNVSTTAEVLKGGRVRVNQVIHNVAGRGDQIYAYDTSVLQFEGTLSQAQEQFQDIDFSDLEVDTSPQFVEIEGIKTQVFPGPPIIETKVIDDFDAERDGGPISIETYLDRTQTALDIIGLIPGFGEVADIANGFISLARGNWVDAGLSFLSAVPGFGYIAAAGKASKKLEGVYDLTTTAGNYVGQSKDMSTRIKRHFGKRGKLKKLNAKQTAKEITYEMAGSSQLERELYEQYVILRKYGGKDNLINKVNPVGGRHKLDDPKGLAEFYKQAEKVIKKYNLPKF